MIKGQMSERKNQSVISRKYDLDIGIFFDLPFPSALFICNLSCVADATWLSTNFGVIVCIECSGIHREMGVHITKIQSLTLDNIGTSQLLVARAMSNDRFNKIMEATAESKPVPNSTMEERKAYIKAKYEEKKFVGTYCENAQEVYCDLEQAIDSHNISDLLQAFGEASYKAADITDPLPSSVS